ncbi:MAG: MerR family DNA-binding transcriptional regulator [Bdellovibrionota bacterium]|nr:MerR family DNA-binding transcriptional regulator [Bdellovibrionota bacterium]
MDKDKVYTVPEMAKELDVTERAIRFYESKGLISPQRAGKNRILSYKDHARLIIILRGKRLGFSLSGIKMVLDLYDADPQHKKQAKAVLKGLEERIEVLEEQREELQVVIDELESLKENCLNILGKTKR